jgi:peroxiredoxin
MRLPVRTLLLGSLVAAAGWLATSALHSQPAAVRDDEPASSLGKAINKLDLKDQAGKTWAAADLKGHKAVVVVFVGTECPINNAYMPRLAEMHKALKDRGVLLLAVNSNNQDTPARIAAHAKEYGLPFPVLHDGQHAAADHFGARRTPEAFVLDGELKVVYQGRIDDQFGVGFQRPKASRDDLGLAVEDVLAGRKVAVATTVVAGCHISRGAKAVATDPAKVTYAKDVSRILQNRCQECHRPGQIGPMPLLTYDDAANWSAMIREVVSEKRMPPWHADEKQHGKFANERALPKDEYNTLLAWIDAGCPRGDDKDLPEPKKFADTWYIGKPDAVFTMESEFAVPAKAPKGGVRYQYFTIKTNFDEDKWVQSAECKPGNRAVVHHVIAYVMGNNKKAGDFNDGLGRGMLSAYAPGDLGSVYPVGAAKKLPKGASIVLQVHYTPNGTECKDRTSVGLIFAKGPPKMEVQTRAINNMFFAIPPNAASHEVKAETTFKQDAILYSLLPHMHLRGKDFKFDIVWPNGKEETILYVPRYDFGWQATYHLKEPLRLPKGTKIKCLAHFDNSKGNPWNPDPSATVRFGEQTWEEMCIGFIDYAYVDEPAEKK